jgi:hypothetical protein
MTIELSTTSQDLISKLCEKNANFGLNQVATIERADLLKWFGEKHPIHNEEDTFFLMSSLKASLLMDLNDSLNPFAPKKKSKKGGWSGKTKYALLALAGTVYFGCEGFDGVTAIMGIFSSIPTIALFAVGTVFSVLSIIVFYSFDLVEISKNLGVKSSDAPKLVDVLLDQFKQIKTMRAQLSKAANKNQEGLENDLAIAKMLLIMHQELNESRMKIKMALENPYLKIGKMITAGVAGIIFFSAGFFAGQTVALAIAGLFVTSIAVTAWPVLVASIVVGLAALSVYWFVERPGIENLISRWRGLDKEKVDMLCKSKVVDRETEKLESLIHNLEEKIQLHKTSTATQLRVQELEKEVARLNGELVEVRKAMPETTPIEAVQINNGEEVRKDVVVPELVTDDKTTKISAHREYSLFTELRKTKSTGEPRSVVYAKDDLYLHTKKDDVAKMDGRSSAAFFRTKSTGDLILARGHEPEVAQM